MQAGTRSALRNLLGLEHEPVALRWLTRTPKNVPRLGKKARFCEKLLMAIRGQCLYAKAEDEECMGGAKYCGLRDSGEFSAGRRSGEFLVAMGVYGSVAAVQRSWQGNMNVEPGIFKAMAFAPLEKAPFEPDVVFILCNARQAMELLHANAYDSGARGIGADAGPICSSMAAIPYLTGKVTYGFGDVGSRKYMGLAPGDVMVSVPGSDLARILSSLERMKGKKSFRELGR
jgi:uncharacterized protein (DUF169 family)